MPYSEAVEVGELPRAPPLHSSCRGAARSSPRSCHAPRAVEQGSPMEGSDFMAGFQVEHHGPKLVGPCMPHRAPRMRHRPIRIQMKCSESGRRALFLSIHRFLRMRHICVCVYIYMHTYTALRNYYVSSRPWLM